MKIHLTKNPPQSTTIQPPQDVGLFPKQSFSWLWRPPPSEKIQVHGPIRAPCRTRWETGGLLWKNKVRNTRHRRSQGFQCYNLSTVLNLARLETQFVSDKKRNWEPDYFKYWCHAVELLWTDQHQTANTKIIVSKRYIAKQTGHPVKISFDKLSNY